MYRIINYGGALLDGNLALGSLMADASTPVDLLSNVADFSVQTSIAGQVNLVNTSGLNLNYWDGDAGPKNNGVINGGDGAWQAPSGNDNWTDSAGAVNAAWDDAQFAIFAGTSGVVTVDDSAGDIHASGMQFMTDGYRIEGDSIGLVGPQSVIRVGDGTTASAGMTATIASVLTGTTRLVKTDLGTLVLTADNTWTGGASIDGGVLEIDRDANLGAASGGLSFNGGTLRTTADITTARATTLDANGGTFETAPATTLTMESVISGSGSLTKTGDGILLLTADNTWTGGTTHQRRHPPARQRRHDRLSHR